MSNGELRWARVMVAVMIEVKVMVMVMNTLQVSDRSFSQGFWSVLLNDV